MSLTLEKVSGLSGRHVLKIQRPWFSADGQREVTLGTLAEWLATSAESPVVVSLAGKQNIPIVASGSVTAVANGAYSVTGVATFTDPAGTVDGVGYLVRVTGGSSAAAIIGGVTYVTGETISRVYDSSLGAYRSTAVSSSPSVISGNWTARVNETIHVTATATISDPASPVQGRGFTVVVRNGTATVGGVAYATAGTIIRRIYHSGAYVNFVDRGATPATQAEVDAGTDAGKPVTPLTLAGNLSPRDAARQTADWLNSDGATASRAQIQTPGPRGNVAGVPSLYGRWSLTVPSTTPPTNCVIGCITGTVLGSLSQGSDNSLFVMLDAGEALRLRANGTTGASNWRIFDAANWRTNNAGQTGVLEVLFVSGTSAPTVWWNGANISSLFVATQNGSPPNWIDPALVATSAVTGFTWPTGPAPLGSWILGSLTDTERTEWRTTGRAPAWVRAGGSAVNLITSNGNLETSSASAGISGTNDFNNWWKGSAMGVAVETVDVPAGSTKAARLTGSGSITSDTIHWFRPGFTGNTQDPSILRTSSQGYRFKAKHISGGNLNIGQGFVLDRFITPAEAADWTEFTGSFLPTSAVASKIAAIILAPVSGAVWLIDDVSVWREGALSIPEVTPFNFLGDGTTLGDNPARLVGMTPQTSRKEATLTFNTTTSPQQALGGDIVDSTRDVIDFIEQTPSSGTPTTTIGSASGGAQYKASGALAAGINPITLVTRKLAGNSIWVSSDVVPLKTTVKLRRVN
jgi:hypothetical protein